MIARAAKHGFNPKDMIWGVDEKGKIYNLAQLHRVRRYAGSDYSRMAGVPLRAGSDLPMPGDSTIAKDKKKWETAKTMLEALPQGSPERESARVALVKQIARDMPTKYGLDNLERTGLSDTEQLQVLRGQSVGKAFDKQDRAGIRNREEAEVYTRRALKAGQAFIDEVNRNTPPAKN